MKFISRVALYFALVSSVANSVAAQDIHSRTMSIEDRFLLNRLVLRGELRIQVMLVCKPSEFDGILAFSRRLRGTEKYVDRKVAYIRIELPIQHLSALTNNPSIDAYHIASLARASAFRDGVPRESAERGRLLEVPPAVRMLPSEPDPALPILDATAAQQAGYIADEDTGIKQWLREHPTFDGRGVTIALIDIGQPAFAHPAFGLAKTLDGQPIEKIAGIVNALDQNEYDQTRVNLTAKIDAPSPWVQIANRTFILPHPGKYLFGFLAVSGGGSLIQQFGVLRSQETGEVWVDTDGDADFRNEQPVLGLEHKFEVRSLKIMQPRKVDVAFVVVAGSTPETLHIYLAVNNHHTMTMSVAAGSRNSGLASGVAAASRVLVVKGYTSELRLSDFIEANLSAAARPDVDILTTSFALGLLPDTDANFLGLLFHRLVAVYNKPIFIAAGNDEQLLATVISLGDTFSVGGTIIPSTFKAFYGGGELSETIIHPHSSAGPARDGALKPDFLAPMERISAATCTGSAGSALPKNKPTSRLPPCYQVSCCTSASSPYAAGIAALLVSAAKQTHIDYSVESLGRALRASARFLPNVPAYKQGSGLLNVEQAWRELQRGTTNPRITVTGENHQIVTPYSQGSSTGPGLYEEEGWTPGTSGTRTLHLQRDGGPSEPTEYKLDWTGNDGTFEGPFSILLPLHKPVSLSIKITPKTAGVHSAILNLYDSATDAIVQRTMSTIVVPERLVSQSHTASFAGCVPIMQAVSNFWEVPVHTSLIVVELTVKQGSVKAIIAPSVDKQYAHIYPASLRRPLTAGTYRFVVPDPSPGVWSVTVTNSSAYWEENPSSVSTKDAEYSLTVRSLGTSFTSSTATDGHRYLSVLNRGDAIKEPKLKSSLGTLTSYEGSFNGNGLPHPFEIQVPPGSSALIVTAQMSRKQQRSLSPSTPGLDLYLYDCTTGECFSHDFALPASNEQRIVVRKPYPGRWVAMIGSPFFPGSGSFTVEGVVVSEKGTKTINLGQAISSGGVRTIQVDPIDSASSPNSVRVYELFDEALERAETELAWMSKEDLDILMTRPTALTIKVEKAASASQCTPRSP